MYPLHQDTNSSEQTQQAEEVVHIYFPPIQQYYGEMVPLIITIFVLFLYVYFSCNKIEVVRSKFGIAATAVVTVLSAICMSLGMSGISLNINPKVYFVPYLVAFISLENILVVTRSVIETPAHLDVKIRVAQGLSKEGWNITKNLFGEITLLSVGFLMGCFSDSSIQEFCLLAVMGLLADYFLQLFFFVTVLSMDMTTLELSDVLRKPVHNKRLFRTPVSGPGIFKSGSKDGTNVMAPQCNGLEPKEAKRVKLLSFWARKRIIQRVFVLSMLVWCSIFIYQGEVLETVLKSIQLDPFMGPHIQLPEKDVPTSVPTTKTNIISAIMNLSSEEAKMASTNFKKLQHNAEYAPWKGLPYTHWPMLFGLYNMSLYGQYITLLPPIRLSMTISPESAINLRHPKETELFSSSSTTDSEEEEDNGDPDSPELSPFVPTSPGELFLAFIFATPSLLFIMYLFVMLYRCVCSKNYAEWRTSWTPDNSQKRPQNDIYAQVSSPCMKLLARLQKKISGLTLTTD